MNQELNVSLEQSSVAVAEQAIAASTPAVLDNALLGQVGGGVSSSGPYGGW
jgi:hypothetical protein